MEQICFMNKSIIYIIITSLIVLVVAISCKKNDDADLEPITVVNNTSVVAGIVLINEMVVKGSTNANEFGELEDWFEIYNPQDTAVTLESGKWYVTDAAEFNNRIFLLPEVTIAANDFLIIWCDDGGQPNGMDIHATFKLSSSGEDVGIYYDDNGSDLAIDIKTYPATSIDGQGYGRLPDGSQNWEYLTNPTPGASNN